MRVSKESEAGGAGPPRRPRSVWPVLLLVAVVGLAALVFGGRVGLGLGRYRSPFFGELPWGSGGEALTRRVVVCLIDGLGDDASRRLPELEALRGRGADLRLSVPEPTASVPVAHVIMSGAPQQTIGLLTNSRVGARWYEGIGHIFEAARRAGLESGHFVTWGSDQTLDELLDAPHNLPGSPQDDDRALLPAALPFLAERPDVELVWVHFDSVDHAGHARGAASDAYRESARRSGERVGRLAAALDLGRDTLIVTSDHGHLAAGGHWGGEPEVATVPAVLAGSGVRAGVEGSGRIEDLAATVAVLLGTPIPTHSQGWPLFGVLELDAETRARRARDAALQRLSAHRARFAALGRGDEGAGDAPPHDERLERLESHLGRGDWRPAEAESAELEAELTACWEAALASERWTHLRRRIAISALLSVVLAAAWLVVRRRRGTPQPPPAWLLGGGLTAIAVPALVYLVGGHRYTLSWVAQKGIHSFMPPRLLEGLVGLAAGYVVARLLRRRDPESRPGSGAVLAGVLAAVAAVVLVVGWVYWAAAGVRPEPWDVRFAPVAFVITETLHFLPMAAVALVAALALLVAAAWRRLVRRPSAS